MGKVFILQPCSLKQELGHDESHEDNWRNKKMIGYLIWKMTFYQELPIMLGIVKVWKS